MAYQNFYATKLQNGIGSSDTTITVQTPPTAPSGRLVLEPRNAAKREIISYAAVVGNQLTGVVRGLSPTSATDHGSGALLEMNFLAQDYQDLLNTVNSFSATNGSGWYPLIQTPTVVSSNGQKEHVIRYTGVDYTNIIGEGTKLKIPRTGTTPTTSMACVSASSQYATKASPTGMTYTDDFTMEAWVYLDSYNALDQGIISRYAGATTGGSLLYITNSGQVVIGGYTATASRQGLSVQSVPLGKWTHIAATLDMSGNVSTIYMDGVPVALTVSGSATSLVQAGSLQVGAYNSASFLNGKVANARIWSTIRTAAQIRDNMNQEVPASTTGLVAHFKGNGSWNDSSANANHLTATGGAINNFASHPYSATEYAIATKVAYTGGNTDVTVFTGNGCLPNETLAATSYSTARAPYGFPAGFKWNVSWIHLIDTVASFSANQWSNMSMLQVSVPTGSWKFSAKGHLFGSSGASVPNPRFSFSTSASSETSREFTTGTAINQANQSTKPSFAVTPRPLEVSAMTTYYPIVCSADNAGTAGLASAVGSTVITLECAYL